MTHRVDRFRQCDGKVRHLDRRAARRARNKLGRSGGDGSHLAIYRCPWCGAFHVGNHVRDPYLEDMAARAAARTAELEDLDDAVARASARVLRIPLDEARRLLEADVAAQLDAAGVNMDSTPPTPQEAPDG